MSWDENSKSSPSDMFMSLGQIKKTKVPEESNLVAAAPHHCTKEGGSD